MAYIDKELNGNRMEKLLGNRISYQMLFICHSLCAFNSVAYVLHYTMQLAAVHSHSENTWY